MESYAGRRDTGAIAGKSPSACKKRQTRATVAIRDVDGEHASRLQVSLVHAERFAVRGEPVRVTEKASPPEVKLLGVLAPAHRASPIQPVLRPAVAKTEQMLPVHYQGNLVEPVASPGRP